MMPNINPRQMQQMMKKMGVKQNDIDDAQQVIIKCSDREIVIDNPSVAKVNMMGQESFQITGQESVRALETKASIQEDDVQMVMDQAGVDKETAQKAIDEAEGDLAQAIMNLQD